MSDIPRDRYGRPLIIPPNGGEPVPYTRVSTFAKCLDDLNNLMVWKQRKTAEGLLRRPDLLTRVAGIIANGDPDTDWSTKKALNEVCGEATEAAGSSKGSSAGTGLHALTEALDRGEEPFVLPQDKPRLDAYRAATYKLTPLGAELFVVNDTLKVAGTFDRLWGCPDGQARIGDLKGLATWTPLATPTGWTTMGRVRVGEQVLGKDGRPCTVTAKSFVKHLDCYRVKFDDGSAIVCDAEHLWETTTGRQGSTSVKPVGDIAARLRDPATGQRDQRVAMAQPLDTPTQQLPIDPYTLGVWLGDGRATGSDFTKADPELAERIRMNGYEVRKWKQGNRCQAWNVIGLRPLLRANNLYDNKHVPDMYLRGDIEQRVELLRGLMDTDGTYNTARKSVNFCSCDPQLALDVQELALSLGERPHLAEVERTGFGRTVKSYDVSWSPHHFNPFYLPRKRDQVTLAPVGRGMHRRLIVEVERIPTVPTQCIAVDSPDNMYLAGQKMVPTHNTGKSEADYPLATTVQIATYSRSQRYDPETGHRWPIHAKLDYSTGLLVHMPPSGGCEVIPLDLEKGWEAAKVADVVHHKIRRWKPADLVRSNLTHQQ